MRHPKRYYTTMKLERWLAREVTNDHYPRKDYSAFVVYPIIIALLGWIFFRRTSPQEAIAHWQTAIIADKQILVTIVFAAINTFLCVRWLLRSLPTGLTGHRSGARGELTGREVDALHHGQKQLTSDLRSIYSSVARPARFSTADYVEAAERLRSFSGMRRDDIRANAQAGWLKILVLSGAIKAEDASVRRVVDLKTIEQEVD